MKAYPLLLILGFLFIFQNHPKAQDLTPVGFYENKGEISYHRFDVHKGNIYWPRGKKGLVVFNAEQPGNLERIKYYHNYEIRSYRKVYGSANAIELRGDTAFLANGELGFEILNMSRPVNPVLLGRYYRHQAISEFKIVGKKAVLGLSENGAEIIDFSDVKDITLASRNNMDDFHVADIEILENYVYVLGEEDGTAIFSFNSPLKEFKKGRYIKTIFPEGASSQLEIRNKTGYLANGRKELLVMDFALPEHPSAIKKLELEGNSNDLLIHNDYLYVATSKGIEVFLLQDKENPVYVGSFYDKKREYKKILIKGNYLYSSYKSSGLFKKNYGLRIFRIQ
jgi:hypothetical protein